MPNPIPFSSLQDIQNRIRSGELSCVQVVQTFLDNAKATKNLNAFLEIYDEEALQMASVIDSKVADGKPLGKLFGLVLSLKDTISQKDQALGASSKILEGYQALYHATATRRLLEEDAIIIGRTNCDEFAMGSSNENSFYGNVGHPRNEQFVPGGSSGGAAVSVAMGCCQVALGSDTGGSIRQPASFCGVLGFKPTYGRVSRFGLIAYASSFDQIGPFAHNVEDAGSVLEVIGGGDSKDATTIEKEFGDWKKQDLPKQIHFAYPEEVLNHDGLDEEIRKDFFQRVEKLRGMGHQVNPVSFELLAYGVPTYYVLTTAEASSNLSRYDGIRYGYRSSEAEGIEETYVKSRSEGFGEEVKRRIMLGTFVLSSGYYDAYYAQAQKVRRVISQKTKVVFKENDFILLPTTPSTAFKQGAKTKDPVAMYLSDIFTVQANICGIPAVSLPLGEHSNGFPFGIQLMANTAEDEKLLAGAKMLMEM